MSKDKFAYEEEIMQFWEKNGTYDKVKEKNKDGQSFNFIDGPPYPTGEPHLGHFRNYTIKDTVLRFQRFLGKNVYARDGYDVHGLPVENKVQAKLGLKTVEQLKKFGEENFVAECKKYVAQIIDNMRDFRNRMGLFMDRNHYQTSHPEYLSLAWKFFKVADEKNLLYKDYKTVAWCPNDQTTLSDYEIKDTYTTLVDPSIYIRFKVKPEFTTTKKDEYFMVWTTTPWTLQSNMAIAVNPEFNYVKALVNLNGEEIVIITGEPLLEGVIKTISKSQNIKLIKILETIKGAELEGVKYEHFYINETPSQQNFLKENHKHLHSVILADFVTFGEAEDIFEKLEKRGYKHSNAQDTKESSDEESVTENNKPKKSEGTGLVHIAPGHGFDDYEAGRKYNLPIFCPVGPEGKFTEGKYVGKYFKDVDKEAIPYLKQKGTLLHSEEKSHRYPCCWRCKTPIVYRAADQWWIKRSEYVKDNIKANKNVKWTPKFAGDSFENLMAGAGDWAISRQRYWGIPIPIWEDEQGNYEVFGSKEELEKRAKVKLDDIHRDNIKNIVIKNKKSGLDMKPVPFITDVWFESGCASFASHYGEGLSFEQIIEKYYPISWITESEDQVRGWFSSLFNVGMVLTGKAPFNQVLFYKFVMDKDGQKMSKSVGNGIDAMEAIENWGSDKSRYYMLTKRAPEEQINFNPEEFSIVDGFFNTLENVFKFTNSYLEEYESKGDMTDISNLSVEDQWIMYKLNLTIRNFTRNMEDFKLNQAMFSVEDFLVKDFSKTYLKLVKERTEERDNDLIFVFEKVLRNVLIMFASAIPFKTEELYQKIKLPRKKESIFLENLPESDELLIKTIEKKGINENFELTQDVIAAILNSREKAKIGVRWPLSKVHIVGARNLSSDLKVFEPMILKLTNIKKIVYNLEGVKIDYNVKPNFPTLKEDMKENMQSAIKAINMNKSLIAQDLQKSKISGVYDNIKLDYEKHILKEVILPQDLVASEFSGGQVVLHTEQDEILLESGFLRELIRRVQQVRKDLGLNKNDEIEVSFAGSDNYYVELAQNWKDTIAKKVGAKKIVSEKLDNISRFVIKEKELLIGVKV